MLLSFFLDNSPFGNGFFGPCKLPIWGIRWVVGDGRKIRFWEDHWIGNTSLAIVYWHLSVVCEQQGKISMMFDMVSIISGEAGPENDLGRTSTIKILHGQSETPRLAAR